MLNITGGVGFACRNTYKEYMIKQFLIKLYLELFTRKLLKLEINTFIFKITHWDLSIAFLSQWT